MKYHVLPKNSPGGRFDEYKYFNKILGLHKEKDGDHFSDPVSHEELTVERTNKRHIHLQGPENRKVGLTAY